MRSAAAPGVNLTGGGSDNIYIGNPGLAADKRAIRIGDPNTQTATYLGGVKNAVLGGALKTVVINSNGRLGVTSAFPASASRSTGGTTSSQKARLKAKNREINTLKSQVADLSRRVSALEK